MMFIKLAVLLATVCLSGAVYTRWGREDCPGSSTLVYAGYAGGSHYSHPGGAAEFLCLPKDPDFVTGISTTSSSAKAYVYGAEYEFGDLRNSDVPCAVCLEPGSSSQPLMIPARNSCHSGWSVAYNGLLASGYYNFPSASQFICLDAESTGVADSSINRDGKLVFPAVAKCGSLKCLPYQNDAFLACVVCVKN